MKKEMICRDTHIVRLDNLPAGIRLGDSLRGELLEMMKQCNYDQNKFCYIAGDGYISRVIAGETVLIPMNGQYENAMITFNETGAFLWALLQEKRTAGELVYELQREFDVSAEAAEADVQRFLDNALGCGMVVKA